MDANVEKFGMMEFYVREIPITEIIQNGERLGNLKYVSFQ
jgi:hypothetical protein